MAESTLETPAADVGKRWERLGRLGRSNAILLLCWFALILALKWPTLVEPPVWDASMSVFPAAITLAESNFDLGYLLDQPGYLDGGPNVHSLSLITWLTAGVMAVIGFGPDLFPVLHIVHFLIAAFALTGLYRLGELAFGSTLAAVTAVTALTIPVVLTQVGSMYLEIALLATAVHAVLAWQRNRLVAATAFASAAVLIKGSGVLIGGALAVAALLTRRPLPEKLRSAAVLVTPSIIVSVFLFDRATVASSYTYGTYRFETSSFLSHIPDVLLLLILFAFASFLTLRHDARSPASSPSGNEHSKPVLISAALVVLAFVGFFFVILPLTGKFFSVLPRYYTLVVPFMLLGLAAVAHRQRASAVAFGGLALLLVFSIANRNGSFYADNDLENFALIERSGAYVALLDLQQMGIQAVVALPDDVPVFYDQPVHYKLSYPQMGYAQGPIPGGHSIFHETPFRDGRLADFPAEFYMLYEYPWLGGEIIQSVREQALADPSRDVVVKELCSTSFCSDIIHVLPATGP
jgi:hypothetical protein